MRAFFYFLLIAFVALCSSNRRIRRASLNTTTVTNKGSKAITIALFKNLGDYQPSFQAERTIHIPSGVSQTATLNHGWEGRVQKLSGAPSDASFMGMTFCDISLIRGLNGAMQFSSQDGSLRTGFTNDLYPEAPSKFRTKDSGGNNVLEATEPYTGGTNDELVNYYREKLSNGNGYLLPDDHASSHDTKDKIMNLAIY